VIGKVGFCYSLKKSNSLYLFYASLKNKYVRSLRAPPRDPQNQNERKGQAHLRFLTALFPSDEVAAIRQQDSILHSSNNY
jgi:hypothetical protein